MHGVSGKDLLIEQPRDTVWPILRDIRSWYPEYDWKVVDGPAYESGGGLQEGQTMELRSTHPLPRVDAAESGRGDFYTTKMLKVADWEIVSVLYGQVYDWKRYTAFYVWRLVESGPNTVFTVDSYLEAEFVDPLSDEELDDYRQRLTDNWHRSWSTAFDGLVRVLAGESGAAELTSADPERR
jgi:hypothetical protein